MAMGDWLGLATSGQDAIAKLLARREIEQQYRLREQAAKRDLDNNAYKRSRDTMIDERETREFDERMKLNREQIAGLEEQRTASAEERRAKAGKANQEAEAEAAQRKQMAEFIKRVKADPNASREDRMLAVSFAHQLMTGKAAPSEVFKDRDAEFKDFTRRADYTEGLRRSRPDKTTDTSTKDDPKLPRGVKNYILQISQEFPSDFGSAQKKLMGSWNSLTAAHPNVDPGKASDLLRKLYAQAPGSNNLGIIIADAIKQTQQPK